MKILLNGATAGTNFGDFLFAEAFQQEVSKLVCEDNVYWYESRYKQLVPYGYPTQLCNILNEMDLIITPKLHVGIVGATLSKSVISFSIHAQIH